MNKKRNYLGESVIVEERDYAGVFAFGVGLEIGIVTVTVL
jgi:hypothetical protein